jgi:arginine deiminase
VAVVAIIVVVAIGALGVAVLNSDAGKVQFAKTAYDQSKTTCHMDNVITTANVGDTIYMIAAFKDTLDAGQNFTLTVTKDGQKYGDSTPTSLPTQFNCYIEQTGINLPDSGVYKFAFTKDGKTEAEGTLTVK